MKAAWAIPGLEDEEVHLPTPKSCCFPVCSLSSKGRTQSHTVACGGTAQQQQKQQSPTALAFFGVQQLFPAVKKNSSGIIKRLLYNISSANRETEAQASPSGVGFTQRSSFTQRHRGKTEQGHWVKLTPALPALANSCKESSGRDSLLCFGMFLFLTKTHFVQQLASV